MDLREINMEDLVISDFNTRKDLGAGTEDAGLDDLARSIEERGLISPVTVRTRADGKFDIIAGQRRFLAYDKLGRKNISAIVRDGLNDTDATILSLVENVHRADMSPMDKARAYETIHQESGSYADVARHVNVSATTVKRYIVLNNLTPRLQERLSTSDGPAGVGTYSVAATYAPEDQEEAMRRVEGFKQGLQQDILRSGGGDLDKLPGLRDEALEDNFGVVMCGEMLCPALSPQLRSELIKALEQAEDPLTLREFLDGVG